MSFLVGDCGLEEVKHETAVDNMNNQVHGLHRPGTEVSIKLTLNCETQSCERSIAFVRGFRCQVISPEVILKNALKGRFQRFAINVRT